MKAILIPLSFLGRLPATIGDARKPISPETIRLPRPPARRTPVIVLPGLAADGKEMKERGVATAIQEVWPEADVLLASATFDYYRKGKLVERLHDEVVRP